MGISGEYIAGHAHIRYIVCVSNNKGHKANRMKYTPCITRNMTWVCLEMDKSDKFNARWDKMLSRWKSPENPSAEKCLG